jgi:hypothetical protein
VLYSSQDHLGTETHDLGHPILSGAKNTDKLFQFLIIKILGVFDRGRIVSCG